MVIFHLVEKSRSVVVEKFDESRTDVVDEMSQPRSVADSKFGRKSRRVRPHNDKRALLPSIYHLLVNTMNDRLELRYQHICDRPF